MSESVLRFRFDALACSLPLLIGCAEPSVARERTDGGGRSDAEPVAAARDAMLAEIDAAQGEAPDSHTPDALASLDAALDAAPERPDAGADVHEIIDAGAFDATTAPDAGEDAALPPQSPTAKYRVERYIGALDHLIIEKRDEARGYCVITRIAAPSRIVTRYSIELAPNWSLEGIRATENPACQLQASDAAPLLSHEPAQAVGKIEFREVTAGGQVCSLDLDIALTFRDAGVVPERDHLFARQLAAPCDR